MTARVLVVDDVELNVKLLEAKLSSEYQMSAPEETGNARILLLAENDPAAPRIMETLAPVAASVRRAKSCAQAQSLLDPSIELVIASLSVPDSDPLRLVSQWRAAEA